MTMDSSHKKLAVAICDYIQECIAKDLFKRDDAEGLQVAIQCIQEAYQVDPTEPDFEKTYSIQPATLKSVFDVFMTTQQKVSQSTPSAAAATRAAPVDTKSADELKGMGNKKMAEKDYKGAIDCYTQAIALVQDNAVYYANRAAAYSQNNQHDLAVQDSKKALEIDPDYSKAYSRMGHAHFCLGEFEQAVSAYEKGLQLDPNNASMKQSLTVAQQKLGEVSGQGSNSTTRATEDAGNPLAGLGDLGSMLNNPGFMDMASKMMSNPNFAQMLNNPAVASMAQNLMSNPSALQGLMGNPDVAKMAANMMNKE